MPANVNVRSRLRFKQFVEVGGVEFWDFDNLPDIPQSKDDIYYCVQEGDRIDLLAARFYGDPNLWWVIAEANNIELVPTQLVPATTIRIPSPAYVNETLFNTPEVQQ
jgi:hypothetical protein